MIKEKFNIKGMRCKSCEMLIRDALENLGASVKADHKSGVVEVEYDKSKIDKIEIINTIKKVGFKVKK